jgi:S-adenosylmethionine/arginine decarboxylase-like enzyme
MQDAHILKDMLKALIDENKHLPEQGTDEWLMSRKLTFGGSEMSQLLECNPYGGVKDLMASKIGLLPFSGNLYTRWGNMFEACTEDFTSIIFDTKLYFTGSLPGKIKNQAYSPDGLSVVKLICETSKGDKERYFIVLFEFKAPFSTIPCGEMVKHYMPQVQTGLATIDIADCAIFVNNMYRRTRLKDFKYNATYDTKFHTGDFVKSRKKKEKAALKAMDLPVAMGLIYFSVELDKFKAHYEIDQDVDENTVYYEGSDCGSDRSDYSSDDSSDDSDDDMKWKSAADFRRVRQTSETNANDMASAICDMVEADDYKAKFDNFIDASTYSQMSFEWLMEMLGNKLLKVNYSPMVIFNEQLQKNEFLSSQKTKAGCSKGKEKKAIKKFLIKEKKKQFDKTCFCVLPWKLFISDIIYIEEEPGFRKKYTDAVKKWAPVLEELATSTDKLTDFYKHFENKNSWKDRQIMQGNV